MTDKSNDPASDAETQATQPTEPVKTEDTTVTEPKTPVAEPKDAATQTRAQSKPQTPDAPAAPDAEAVATRAREGERDRVSTIYDLAGRLNLERSFAEDLVKRGTDIGEARRLILDQVAAKSEETRTFSQVSIPLGGRDEQVTRRDAVANALLHRYSPTLFTLEDAARQYRGMTLMELARESLGNAGVNTRGLSRDEVATRALHSTSDFPEILSAVTNKTLRQAYEAYPRTFMLFCRQVLATDFKAMHRVQLGEAPQLLEVSESGEFKRGTLGESKESYKVKTYGRVVAITRQTLINDDLDAFTRIPAMYGNSIAQLEEMNGKLQINQSAAHQLHVKQTAGRFVLCHFIAHFQHVLAQPRRIPLLRQHIGDQPLELSARRITPHQNARAGKRHVLPGPRRFALILLKSFDRNSEWPLSTLRPQARIDLVKRAMGGRH